MALTYWIQTLEVEISCLLISLDQPRHVSTPWLESELIGHDLDRDMSVYIQLTMYIRTKNNQRGQGNCLKSSNTGLMPGTDLGKATTKAAVINVPQSHSGVHNSDMKQIGLLLEPTPRPNWAIRGDGETLPAITAALHWRWVHGSVQREASHRWNTNESTWSTLRLWETTLSGLMKSRLNRLASILNQAPLIASHFPD